MLRLRVILRVGGAASRLCARQSLGALDQLVGREGNQVLTRLRRLLREQRSDAGASAVEFALIFPIFMVLAMGTIAAGTAFNRQINVTQASREASRYGATYDIATAGGIDAWLTTVMSAAQQSAGDANSPISGWDYICVAYVSITDNVSPAVDMTKSKYKQVGLSPASGNNACPTTRPALIRNDAYVQVVVAKKTQFYVLFANPSIHVDGVSVTPYEGTRL